MFHFIPLRQLTRHKIFQGIFYSQNKKTGIVLNLFNLITLPELRDYLAKFSFFSQLPEVNATLYEIYRHKEVLFSFGLLLQENSKVQVH